MLTSSSSSSSSLWRISSRVYHHPEDCYYEFNEGVNNNNNVDEYRMEVRSMCEEIMPSRREIERSASSVSFQSRDFEVEESMDYLWEDFNEEEKKEFKGRKSTSEDMSFMQVNKIGRKTSNGNSGTKLLVLGKLMKGLVSIRKSAQLKFSKARF
uniref:Uncharacterized protein n=1 Tax=Chenopodium quinoa TaxID=63459 RepID=A0A803L534_CHEQI